MAGKHRRSVSISKVAYEALTGLAKQRGVSASSIVESFIRREAGLPRLVTPWSGDIVEMVVKPEPVPHAFKHEGPWPRGAAAAPRAVETTDERAARIAAARLQADTIALGRAAEVAAKRLEKAEMDPCRKERCSIVGLHPAHSCEADRTN